MVEVSETTNSCYSPPLLIAIFSITVVQFCNSTVNFEGAKRTPNPSCNPRKFALRTLLMFRRSEQAYGRRRALLGRRYPEDVLNILLFHQ